MVEFALALPVVLALIFGIIEFGYLIFSYSSVNSAAREAARYGIAIGDGVVSGQRYYDCTGIINAGLRIGQFAQMEAAEFDITYDSGHGTAVKYSDCATLAAQAGSDSIVGGVDRIVVEVTHNYTPIAALMGFDIAPFPMTASSSRTIVKDIEVVASGSGSWGGGGGGGGNPACFTIAISHTGEGADPTISPTNSSGCNLGGFLAGETITLTAMPNVGWSVAGWTGTSNDASISITNTISMPGGNHSVSVAYANSAPPCFALTLSATGAGSGSGPVAAPENSAACGSGMYIAGEVVSLSASADAGDEIAGWSGTDNDASYASPNFVTMPASFHSASVRFEPINPTCYTLAVSHTGSGLNPAPSASNCTGGKYSAGTVVTLNAMADAGYGISSWTGTNNDASTSCTNTVTMSGDKSVAVNYMITTAPDPPLISETDPPPNWLWQNGQKQCRRVDLYWAANASWSESPIYYEVFKGGTSWGAITGTWWDSDFTINLGDQIVLGVRGVFPGGATSGIREVTYACFINDLVVWGTMVK